MTRRLEQLTSDIERGVREVLARGLHDPRVSGLITVTGVRLIPDMSKVFIDVSILPEDRQDLAFHGIASASAYIRREVSDIVRVRVMPEFIFRLDTKLKKEAAIIRELDKIRAQRPPEPPTPEETDQEQ